MKKILFLLFVVAVVFVILNRERLYLRDPIANVTRDGVRQPGVQVYIDYSNDVLLEDDHTPMLLTLVQHGERQGTPLHLKCLHYMACRTEAATPALLPAAPPATVDSMTSKTVSFHDASGSAWFVTLH